LPSDKLYQRFAQNLRKLGASGLMATPTEADIHGPAAADIETHLEVGGAERPGAGTALLAGMGHLHLRLLEPPGTVRCRILSAGSRPSSSRPPQLLQPGTTARTDGYPPTRRTS
jgi:hypothetical protein